MRKLVQGSLLATVIALVLLGLASPRGSALASRTAQPGCGSTVTATTKLKANLIGCPGDGIVIGADHITLDLNGRTVAGDSIPGALSPDAGIRLAGHKDVTIVGGTVQGFDHGILLEGASGNDLRRLTIRSNSGRGILLENDSNANIVENSNVSSNPNHAGIAITSSTGNMIKNDTLASNDVGIFLADGAMHNRVVEDAVSGSPGGGVVIDSSNQNAVDHNRVARNADNIVVSGDGNHIDANVITDAVGCSDGCGFGISIEGGTGNLITDNRIERTARHGIRLDAYGGSVVGTLLKGNSVRSAGGDGIAIDTDQAGPVLATQLEANTTTASAGDGIHVQAAATTLTRNLATDNGNLGIEAVAGVIDGGGNHAFANTNPAQCTNVTC